MELEVIRETWTASLPAWCIQLVKKRYSPQKVYSRPLYTEGQEVLVHFLVTSIFLPFHIDLFTRIHWKKAPKTVFQKERAQRQWPLPRMPAVGKLKLEVGHRSWDSQEQLSPKQKKRKGLLSKEETGDCAYQLICLFVCLFLSYSKNNSNKCQWFTLREILEIILRLVFLFIYIRNTV